MSLAQALSHIKRLGDSGSALCRTENPSDLIVDLAASIDASQCDRRRVVN
jgi:hypothetical protein